MFNEKAFVGWLKNKRNLKQSSIEVYKQSLLQISNFLAEKNIIQLDLFEIDDIKILKKTLNKYLDNKANKEQNERVHRKWSSTISNLIEFFEADLSSSLLEESFPSVYGEDELNSSVSKLEKLKTHGLPKGNKKPGYKVKETKVYERDPKVIDWVLKNANGICEGCKKSAPFIKKKNNTPYLEVHHVIQLKNSGKDIPKNAVALCPNCHREAHSGKKQTALTRKLKKIALSHKDEYE